MDINLGDNRSLIIRLAEKAHSRELPDFLAPPETLGKPRAKTPEYKECMAMDRCIRNVLSGFKDDLMYSATPMFVGYAMLSNISQEALIRAGVETVATEMTRKFIQWTYDDDYGEEDKEKAIADLEEESRKFKLKETFNQAAVKDGYFGGCLVYIDVGELDDDEKEEPLILDEKTFKKGSFKGFKVIEPINIYPGEYNTIDPTDEHYFNPEYWYILGKKYHASRFLYFAGNEAPLLLKPAYNFFGIPQAQLALDYVAHFVANREAAQELLNKFSLTCWKTDMTQALQGRGVNDLVQRAKVFNRLKSNNGMMILDKEREDMVQINTPLSGVRDIVEMSLNLLTAVWHIPKIEYLGEGEGGLNASSKEQIRSYYDYIIGKKEKLFTEPLETVSKVLQLNKWGKINPAISFKFPAMWDMDDSEKAALNKQQADRDAIYLANGVLSQEEVRRRLSLDKNSEYTMIDVDDLPEQAEEPLNEINEQEENEEVRKAMDMAMDDRWITIGARKATETDEGRKGRHILLKEGEEPVEAIERTIKKDIDGNGKVGKSDKAGEKTEKEPKKEPEKKEQPKEVSGQKTNQHIKKYMELANKRKEASKFMFDHEEEFKKKREELRENSKEYQKAKYEYDNADEVAKEKGVEVWQIHRDSYKIMSDLDRQFMEEARNSIDGYADAYKTFNDFSGSIESWSAGVNEIQSGLKERLSKLSEEHKPLIENLSKIENKIPEYRNKISEETKSYREKTKDMDWAQSALAFGEYSSKVKSIRAEIEKEKYEVAKKIGAVLKTEDGQKVGFNSSKIKGLEEKFKEVFDGVLGKGIISDTDKPDVAKRNCRAHYNSNTMTLSGDTDIQTAIHEFMHYVEDKNPQMLANSIAFLRYRTDGEKLKGLKALTGISYGRSEKARADKFFDAYCGKSYSIDDDYLHARATEIMSMGVEEIYQNPAKFAKEDPEYFNFVIANLRGTL